LEIKTLIPFFGIKRQYATHRKELLDATDKVYCSGQVLDGPYTQSFERSIANRCGRKYAVAVNSCTQGLIFAQQVLFQEPTKILIPTISFVATLNTVLMNGNEPVMCDTDNQALIDLESMDYAIKGAGVGGIMYANLFGNTVDWDRFKVTSQFFNQDLQVIEDAAQSFGASYKGQPSGSLGDISVLSFDPTKNLPNYGSGGMVLTDDTNVYRTLRDLRDNGKTNGHENIGTNSKMSEADCAQMLVKLKYFDAWQQRRSEIADYYTANLPSNWIDTPKVTEGTVHAWHKYVIKVMDRNSLQLHLSLKGVETKIHYEEPLYEYPVGYPFINYAADLYREASAFCSECLSLPIYPEMTDAEVEYVVKSVKSFQS
jgi:dTDP-4-amino-4,6-dideoxygalactose transaminase